jgi:hypothetical protein
MTASRAFAGQLEKRRVDYVQGLCTRSVDHLEGWTDLAGRSDAHEGQFDRQRGCYCLEVLDRPRMIRRGRIPEDDDSGKARHRFLEQLETLGSELSQHDR